MTLSEPPKPASGLSRDEAGADGSKRSLLIVTTVSATMTFLLPFVRHFRQRGWQVDGTARGISQDAQGSREFDAVYDLPLSRSIRDVRGVVASAAALSSILGRGYDIVHVHTPIAAFITRAVVRRMPAASRPRVVYTAHGFHFHKDGRALTNAAFLTAEKVAGRWTDRLVVINREDFDAAKRHRIVPLGRLRYMRGIGVDTDWYSRARLESAEMRDILDDVGMDPSRPYFVTVGELNRNKRPTDVVTALANMRGREPALIFLGKGPERARVTELASELGVSDRVFVPAKWFSDVRPFVAGAIALVHASKREGLPRSIMEALCLEVPVIASAARGSRELVGDSRGQVVPIGDTTQMAAAMDRLAQSPEERKAMGKRGRQLMVERYDVSQIIHEHERLYDDLISNGRASERLRQPADA